MTVESTMNLTYQTVVRSCYKPGEILLNARWKGTSPEGRRILIKSEAFQARHEVRRCYSSAVITFSGFPEHSIILSCGYVLYYQVYKLIK